MTIAPSLLTIAAPTNRQPVVVEEPGDVVSVSWVQLGARASHCILVLRDDTGLVARATLNASGSCQDSADHSADGKGRTLHFVRCDHRLSLEGAGSLGGQAATVTVESMTSSPGGSGEPRRLLTPFPLSLTEMGGGTDGWVPTMASVSVVLGPPFPPPPGGERV